MNLLNSEWIKLRTLRSHWVMAIIAVLFPVAVTVLTATFSGLTSIAPDMVTRVLLGTSMVSLLLISVLGALSITGEFTYNTIRPTFAATPHRSKVMAGKAIVVGLVGAALIAIILALGFFIGSAIVDSRLDGRLLADFPDGKAMMIAALVNAPLYALIGLGVGALLRNQALAITALVLWPLLAENLFSGLLTVLGADGIGKYMPYAASLRSIQFSSEDLELSRVASVAIFAAFAVVMLLIGTFAVSRRDA